MVRMRSVEEQKQDVKQNGRHINGIKLTKPKIAYYYRPKQKIIYPNPNGAFTFANVNIITLKNAFDALQISNSVFAQVHTNLKNRNNDPRATSSRGHESDSEDLENVYDETANNMASNTMIYDLKMSMMRLHNEGSLGLVHLHKKVKLLRHKLDEVQRALDKDPANNLLQEEYTGYLKTFNDTLLAEVRFLKQKSKDEKLRVGDSSLSYFHKVVRSHVSRVYEFGEFAYHQHCLNLNIVNLCFADDLFLFAHDDVNSARAIMEFLEEFKKRFKKQVIEVIISTIRLKLLTFRFKKSRDVDSSMEKWCLPRFVCNVNLTKVVVFEDVVKVHETEEDMEFNLIGYARPSSIFLGCPILEEMMPRAQVNLDQVAQAIQTANHEDKYPMANIFNDVYDVCPKYLKRTRDFTMKNRQETYTGISIKCSNVKQRKQ
nr:RNA-directed DNA polymerase, eukaryota, reverse transcriptase zinc-binding domain protein [Tanacetum cinerariifolium]